MKQTLSICILSLLLLLLSAFSPLSAQEVADSAAVAQTASVVEYKFKPTSLILPASLIAVERQALPLTA